MRSTVATFAVLSAGLGLCADMAADAKTNFDFVALASHTPLSNGGVVGRKFAARKVYPDANQPVGVTLQPSNTSSANITRWLWQYDNGARPKNATTPPANTYFGYWEWDVITNDGKKTGIDVIGKGYPYDAGYTNTNSILFSGESDVYRTTYNTKSQTIGRYNVTSGLYSDQWIVCSPTPYGRQPSGLEAQNKNTYLSYTLDGKRPTQANCSLPFTLIASEQGPYTGS